MEARDDDRMAGDARGAGGPAAQGAGGVGGGSGGGGGGRAGGEAHPGDPGLAPGGGAAGARPRARRRWWMLGGIAASAAALAACAHRGGDAMSADGGGCGPRGGWHRHHRGMARTPEEMAARVDRGVERVLSQVGASAEQKQRVSQIAKAALGELAPLRTQHREARQRAMSLLAAPTIDRAALEQLRSEQMRLAEQASRRITQSLADAAEVLTPEQRATLRERVAQRFRSWPGS